MTERSWCSHASIAKITVEKRRKKIPPPCKCSFSTSRLSLALLLKDFANPRFIDFRLAKCDTSISTIYALIQSAPNTAHINSRCNDLDLYSANVWIGPAYFTSQWEKSDLDPYIDAVQKWRQFPSISDRLLRTFGVVLDRVFSLVQIKLHIANRIIE